MRVQILRKIQCSLKIRQISSVFLFVIDSKWKTGQTTFVMQLKIKYFVNDIALLRHFLTQHFFYLQFRQMILA
ncbi:unnamed protein product, partial [Rotaria sp. Silwood1]